MGLALGAIILLSLALAKEAFLAVVIVAVGIGVWELRRALAQANILVPLVPSLVGLASMIGSAYVGARLVALGLTLGLTCVGILLWRGGVDGVGDAMRDISGGMFVALTLLPGELRPAARSPGRCGPGDRLRPRHRAERRRRIRVRRSLGAAPHGAVSEPEEIVEGFAGLAGRVHDRRRAGHPLRPVGPLVGRDSSSVRWWPSAPPSET